MSDISIPHVHSRGRIRSPADDSPHQVAFRCGKCGDAVYVGRDLAHPVGHALGIQCGCDREEDANDRADDEHEPNEASRGY
jgi:hypothetical protein